MSQIKPRRAFVFSLRAADLPTTAHFYRDVIGLSLLPHHGGRVAFGLGDGVHLVILKGEPNLDENLEADRFPTIAFEVEDLDGAVERLKAHGVELPWGIEENQSARWVMFHDPAGNLIELAQLSRSIRA
jgi:catechol-2,3-dioxygenase